MNTTSPSPHTLTVRVYYENTDAGGVVYHAEYLRFLERGRTEFLRAHHIDHPTLQAMGGLSFVVSHLDIRYLAPARLDDQLVVKTQLIELKKASLHLEQYIEHGDKILTKAHVKACVINTAGRPRPLPNTLYASLSKILLLSK